MSDELDDKNTFNIVALPGAASLSEEALDAEVELADAVLKSMGYPRKEIVHWQPDSTQPPSPFVAALVDVVKDGVGHTATMYIGLALEVIQAVQSHEK